MNYNEFSLEKLLNYTHDSLAWYWLGMAYWDERNDFKNAALWLTKTMDDPNNEWSNKAAQQLGMLNMGFLPDSSKDKALDFFEKSINLIISRLNAGFLYHEGTETRHDPTKGKNLVEEAISLLIKKNGNDDYLAPNEFYKIAVMYEAERQIPQAIEYYRKASNKCDLRYESDRRLKQTIEDILRELNG